MNLVYFLTKRLRRRALKTILINLINYRFRHIVQYSERSVEKREARYYEFAVFGLIFCLYQLFFLDNSYEIFYSLENQFPMNFIEMVMRIFAGLGCLILGLQHFWKEEFKKKYLPVCFHLIMMCSLPFLSIYSYLVSPTNEVVLLSGILSIFSVALLVDWLTFIIIISAGFVMGNLAYLCFSFMVEQNIVYIDAIVGELVYLLLSSIMALILYLVQERQLIKLKYAAITDRLTGLYNSYYLDMRLQRMIVNAQGREKNLSIMIINVDYLKNINSTYGYQIGDRMIKTIANNISNNMRTTDVCARYKYEEFIVIMPDVTCQDIEIIAERLRYKITRSPIKISCKPYSLNCNISVGIAEFMENDTLLSLKNRALIALNKAKESGGNIVVMNSTFTDIDIAS